MNSTTQFESQSAQPTVSTSAGKKSKKMQNPIENAAPIESVEENTFIDETIASELIESLDIQDTQETRETNETTDAAEKKEKKERQPKPDYRVILPQLDFLRDVQPATNTKYLADGVKDAPMKLYKDMLNKIIEKIKFTTETKRREGLSDREIIAEYKYIYNNGSFTKPFEYLVNSKDRKLFNHHVIEVNEEKYKNNNRLNGFKCYIEMYFNMLDNIESKIIPTEYKETEKPDKTDKTDKSDKNVKTEKVVKNEKKKVPSVNECVMDFYANLDSINKMVFNISVIG